MARAVDQQAEHGMAYRIGGVNGRWVVMLLLVTIARAKGIIKSSHEEGMGEAV